ncbi:hypothetical protein BDAP_001328 [Binucleata daphniae]
MPEIEQGAFSVLVKKAFVTEFTIRKDNTINIKQPQLNFEFKNQEKYLKESKTNQLLIEQWYKHWKRFEKNFINFFVNYAYDLLLLNEKTCLIF